MLENGAFSWILERERFIKMTEEISRRRSTPIEVAQQMKQRIQQQPDIERVDFINTGCTVLNLAASQKGRKGGWARGRIINIVGDGSSGKTLLALEACAQSFYNLKKIESTIWQKPKNVQIVYNNVEGVMDMPIDRMYGQEFVDAVEWIPDGNEIRDKPMTVEAMGRDLFKRIDGLQKEDALIYVVDSLDSMTTEAGVLRTDKSINTKPKEVNVDDDGKVKKEKKEKGTYGSGVERAKYLSSEFFGPLCSRMGGKDVTIFFISQVREKLDAMAFGEKYYRAGGKALDFYTHQVCWLAQVSKLFKGEKERKRIYGTRVKALFKRNKVAVPYRDVEFDILFNYGVDNISSCCEFLTPAQINSLHGGKRMSRADFVAMADGNEEIREKLIDAVEAEWALIEKETQVTRNNRWGK